MRRCHRVFLHEGSTSASFFAYQSKLTRGPLCLGCRWVAAGFIRFEIWDLADLRRFRQVCSGLREWYCSLERIRQYGGMAIWRYGFGMLYVGIVRLFGHFHSPYVPLTENREGDRHTPGTKHIIVGFRISCGSWFGPW